MSDTSEDTLPPERLCDKDDGNICRDFARGFCDRKFCKYKHDNETKQLNFCHDFQNAVCPRAHCKFIHCTPEEVEEYKRTGQMSGQILAEATRKNQLPGTTPICNQFKKGGICRRNFCKYRHITKEQEEAEIVEMIQQQTCNNQMKQQLQQNPPQQQQILVTNNNNNVNSCLNEKQLLASLGQLNGGVLRRNGINFEEYQDDGLPLVKRRFLTQDQELAVAACDLIENHQQARPPVFKGYFAGNCPSPMLRGVDARTLMLEEEISMLHKEIAQLKKKVSDLTATNEFLLDQNASLRINGKRNGIGGGGGGVASAVNCVPSVTITNGNNAHQQQQQQQVNRTVIASVATVPVSLATVSSCNPVSGNHSVSIAGCPAVSIASPAQLLAPSQQILVTTNPSTQLAIANSSQAQLAIANSSQAQLAIAQQNLANNLAAAQAQQQQQQHQQQQQPQLTSQAQQQLALAAAATTAATQQHAAALTNHQQQLALASAAAAANNHHQQQQHLAAANQQLTTSQAQQLATLASTSQQLTSQAQQLASLASSNQLTSQAQQLTVASVPQQLALASTSQQLLAQQNLAAATHEMHRNNQINAAMSGTSQAAIGQQPMVSFPLMTQQSINHALTH